MGNAEPNLYDDDEIIGVRFTGQSSNDNDDNDAVITALPLNLIEEIEIRFGGGIVLQLLDKDGSTVHFHNGECCASDEKPSEENL